MKKITSLLLILVVVAGLISLYTACKSEPSSDVNQDKIYTEYALYYDGNADKTYARASFKFSNIAGTLLELDAPSEVTFNSDVLTFNSTLAYYEKEYAGLISSGTFVWTDLDGNSFTNAITMKPITFPAVIDSINKDSAFTLYWVGDSLSADESVTLTAVDASLSPQIFYQNDINSNYVILAANQLALLLDGSSTLNFDRYYKPALVQQNTAGGLITGHYRPPQKTAILY
ncbi:MAG: hypothetical protein V1904_14355 [Bacteroidota bacterium]